MSGSYQKLGSISFRLDIPQLGNLAIFISTTGSKKGDPKTLS
jgi:hypothetical protein